MRARSTSFRGRGVLAHGCRSWYVVADIDEDGK
jgi:hypothetical protein